MEMRQILYFIEVAKTEHVTKASTHLHVAQSAVSRQIGLLEAELGVSLFIREGRNVKLTSIGRLFLQHAEKAISELNQAKEKITEHLNPEQGVIRLGFAASLSVQTLSLVLAQFREAHPNIRFQLHQGSLDYLIELIEKGSSDIAFTAPVPREHPNIKGDIFYREHIMAVLPIQHPLATQTMLRLSQLRDEKFVTFRPGLPLYDIVQEACQQAGIQPAFAFEGEDIDTIKSLVIAGFGVALLPEQALTDLPPELVKMKISEPEVFRTVGVITPRHRVLAPSEMLLHEFLRDFYNRLSRFGQ
ncbi:LysR family transcriptional activator of glutamate synthase operon [Pullulanibacillus pueri]|uniref:HTH-type transcriptional regulator GltC n=1 Tax=Pullulanibacillus pueri TaxID=1437324 RepID=A0A8J2ZS52_9BACL|nr:LysR substrate-binding domain-containing protein [Pullulanibacillus pueri]MBM7680371.1 LysR family transcriptional activator of glutamate synthase operon [Pullulanibacillus pueri]GGH75406.1 HTH-type transcriptional regulator GltC [Pullulanibacillus pueri]